MPRSGTEFSESSGSAVSSRLWPDKNIPNSGHGSTQHDEIGCDKLPFGFIATLPHACKENASGHEKHTTDYDVLDIHGRVFLPPNSVIRRHSMSHLPELERDQASVKKSINDSGSG